MSKSISDLDRFWSKVDKSGECWTWIGSTVVGHKSESPYGQFWATERVHRAHRWIYGQLVEALVDGSAIDHLCRNTLCVRLDHLEQVTQRVNILRGIGPAARAAAMTQCSKGHEFTEANTMIRPSGRRRCRLCHLAEQAAYNEKRKRARAAA